MAQHVPNLFIVGTPRSGTTSLARWLGEHPAVAGGRRKEPMFHATDLPSPLSFRDEQRYLSLWERAGTARHLLDASPWYLFSKEAPSSIAKMSPDARFIVLLRDPVDLIASLHAHHVFTGYEPESSLEEAVFGVRPPDRREFRRSIDYLEVVRLAPQLSRFYEQFDDDQVVFIDFDVLSADPEQAYLPLLDRLGLPEVHLDTYPHLNKARHTRIPGTSVRQSRGAGLVGRAIHKLAVRLNTVSGRPPVTTDLRARILERIEPDVEELEGLVKRELASWKQIERVS